ncbi:MAG: DUF952 domain-containing protein [Micromonosporaceae bacterium]|nr:DUF952 domain-containing protein [Micromonosporaceae bacterium]
MALIYHIARATDWQRALPVGEYRISTVDKTLEQQGFIHASTASQVAGVANAIFAGVPDLVLLLIDEDLVGPEIRYEAPPGGTQRYPHIYGPLGTDAVVGTQPLEPGADGRFHFAG